ncbi:MAG TPA: hypothetical protein VMI31_13550 [Fimbriimonadaceae bacterium]|nr:hypothetical protein [Fimbriimonadaceae bacterium]
MPFLLASSPPPIFSQSIAAFRARKSFSVAIAQDTTLNGRTQSARYHLSFQPPGRILLTRIVSGKPSLVYWLNGNRFLAYDPIGQEMTLRKPRGGEALDRLIEAAGNLDESVTDQLSPSAMGAFISRLGAIPGWSTRNSGGQIVAIRRGFNKGKPTLAELDFSASTKLVTKALLEGPGSRMAWSFEYGVAPKDLSFRVPAGTKKVSSLSEHIPINASDPKTRILVDQSLRAYERLTSIAYSVTGTDGASDNWMDGGAFCEKGPRAEWSYRNGVLAIRDKALGRTYRGRCSRSDLLNYLKLLHAPADPVLTSLLRNRNPLRGWILPGMRLTGRGSVSVGGVTSDAIEMRSAELDLSVLIRSDNHLVSSVSSRITDPSGQVVSQTEHDFHYWTVNRPIRSSSFAISATKFLPLSAIGKK